MPSILRGSAKSNQNQIKVPVQRKHSTCIFFMPSADFAGAWSLQTAHSPFLRVARAMRAPLAKRGIFFASYRKITGRNLFGFDSDL
jgi:hypothetical protein